MPNVYLRKGKRHLHRRPEQFGRHQAQIELAVHIRLRKRARGERLIFHGSAFIDYLPNCIVIIVFWVLGRKISPLGQCTHLGRLQSPEYLAHTSTVSLSLR